MNHRSTVLLAFLLPSLAVAANYAATAVHTFAGPEGANPNLIILGPNGTFYGTAAGGGSGYGTLFQVNADNSVTLLHAFQGVDGSDPTKLAVAANGDIYGVTAKGGNTACSGGCGTVFKYNMSTGFTSLYQFAGGSDGYAPTGITLASDGNFYGTVNSGITAPGNVFKITASTGGFSVFYPFCSLANCADGGYPSGIMSAQDGNLYGTLWGAGNTIEGSAVFKLTLGGQESLLGTFLASNVQNPNNLVQTADGNFFLTFDRTACCSGAFDRLSQQGVLTQIEQFDYTNGYPPFTLTVGSDGDVYGTAAGGGTSGEGLVFQYTTGGVFNNFLYSFLGLYDGASPTSIVQTAGGALYTSVQTGGYSACGSCGTIDLLAVPSPLAPTVTYFNPTSGPAGTSVVVQGSLFSNATAVKIGGVTAAFQINSGSQITATVPAGAATGQILVTNSSGTGGSVEPFEPSPFTLSTTYAFCPSGGSGTACNGPENPTSLVMTGSGAVFGTTPGGDALFELNARGVPTVIPSGAVYPNSLLAATDGNLYGSTVYGGDLSASAPCNVSSGGEGSIGCGTLFQINRRANFSLEYIFRSTSDGGFPESAVVQTPNGSIYGATSAFGASGYGTLFKMSTLTGNPTTLYAFHGTSDGSAPYALLAGQDGNVYGATGASGSSPTQTLFQFNPSSGALVTLHSLNAATEGSGPASLIRMSDGTIYGVLSSGGPTGFGSVFQLSTTNALTTVYQFTGGLDGANPASLFLGQDGNLYGVTATRGAFGGGTVFRMTTGGSITTMFSFVLSATSSQHGWQPDSLIAVPGGLMGTTYMGGALTCAFGEGCGTIFMVTIP